MNSHKLFLMKMQDARPSTCHNLNYCHKSQCHAGDADETAFTETKKGLKYATNHAHSKSTRLTSPLTQTNRTRLIWTHAHNYEETSIYQAVTLPFCSSWSLDLA